MTEQSMNEKTEAAFAARERLGITDEEWTWAMSLACEMAANGSKLGAAVMLVETRREAIKQERERVQKQTCPTCGTGDVALAMICHNSACQEYATERTIYEGWKDLRARSSAPDSLEK